MIKKNEVKVEWNIPLQCTATAWRRYGESGVFGGISDVIFISLPSGVYNLTIS